ncbi:MAG: 1-acyl-sn-glycerol-3-phosphate acyltransferase [Muribaculaceae bacterium]|nr:1-acyl-sn-glycerol-3-phosphate acyltransferase [Muribaculaceae bacterium]
MIRIIYEIYKWLIAFPLIFITTILITLCTAIGSRLFGSKFWGYYPPHFWGKLWCWLFFVKVKVNKEAEIDPSTSYVFVANHQGAYDIFSIFGFLNHNFRWMMKKSITKIPLIGMACKYSEQIFVDRSSAMAMARSIIEAKKRLRNGMSIVVFPEGTRTLDGKMSAFKKGAFKLAMDFKLPIVPLTIDGSFNILPRTSIVNIKYGKIILTIHKPIYPSKGAEDMDSAMKETYNAIQSALPAEHQTPLD